MVIQQHPGMSVATAPGHYADATLGLIINRTVYLSRRADRGMEKPVSYMVTCGNRIPHLEYLKHRAGARASLAHSRARSPKTR
jgi:hypothetical protein